MKKIFLASIIVFMLGCSFPTQTSTIPPSATHTIIPISTSTPRPATPTATSFPPLQTNGPYFSYFRKIGEEYQLVMMDTNGKGRKEISIPNELIESLQNVPDIFHVSPDGNWFAFYTGWAGFPDISPSGRKFDLTLNLYNFSTGEWQVITPLLSQDYPNNFKEAAEELNNPSITSDKLYYAFLFGIDDKSLAWSPDGQYLAFAGQIDGLSSDVYIYEMETKFIRRLSTETQEIQSIRWSPDSKWIVYHAAHEILEIDTKFDVYAVSIDGKQVKQISTTTSGFPIWVNSYSYIEYDTDFELGISFGYRLVNINTNQIKKIWDGPVKDLVLNAEKKKIVFITHLFPYFPYLSSEPDPDFVPRLYLMELDTFTFTNITMPDEFDVLGSYFIDNFNINNNLFIIASDRGIRKSYLLSNARELTELSIGNVDEISVSPDSNYWIAVKEKTIDIYSKNNLITTTINLPFQDAPTAFFVWKPDSTGLIAIHEFNIYSIDVLTDEVILLESNLIRRLFSFGVRLITEQ